MSIINLKHSLFYYLLGGFFLLFSACEKQEIQPQTLSPTVVPNLVEFRSSEDFYSTLNFDGEFFYEAL